MVEGLEDLGCMWNKTMIEIHHANEPLKRFDVERLGILRDGFDLGWERLDTILVESLTKKPIFVTLNWHFLSLITRP